LKQHADPVVSLLLAAAVRHISADLAFLDDVEEQLLSGGAALLATLADNRRRLSTANERPLLNTDPAQAS
jgi:hypothetical protein